MTTRGRASAAHAAEVAALGLGLAAGCLLVASVALTDGVLLGGVEPLVGSAVFAVVGVVLAARLPANPIGWLLLTSAVCVAGQEAADAWWETQAAAAPAIEGPALTIGWLSTWLWIPGVALVPVFGFLLFPAGRLPSRRWAPLLWGGIAGLAMLVIALWTASWQDGGFSFPPGVENPLRVAGLDPVRQPLMGVALVLLFATAFGGVASLVVRYRRSQGEERQQLKWIAFGAVAAALVHVTGGLTTRLPLVTASTVRLVSLSIFPVTVAIAILLYRLYDIDRVISRTVSYTVLTGVLALVYVTVVFALQQLVRPVAGGESPLAVAGATLLVAGLFRPARRRIQAVVDRRFHRTRYDAARTVEAFRARMRDPVDLDEITRELTTAANDAVAPATVSVWLRPSGSPR